MFRPLLASHFIYDFLAFKMGTVLPDVNADCFASCCKLQIYFHVEEKMNSLFSFVNSILACLVFSFSKSRI